MTEIEQKTGMTNTECEQWDDYYTENTFEPGPNLLKQGVSPGFARNPLLLSDRDTAEYARLQARPPASGVNSEKSALRADFFRI